MSNVTMRDIQVPVVVTTPGNRCDIYVPDLEMTIHGSDYVEAFANATLKASAVYFYNLERNLKFDLKTKFTQASNLADKVNGFATYIKLQA